jgi:large subunit ribosomal protein L25
MRRVSGVVGIAQARLGGSLQSAPVAGERVKLEVHERSAGQLGSRNARRLRGQGLIPGVLYGKGHSRAIVVGERDLRAALTGPSGLHAIVDVVIEGQSATHHAVLKDYQRSAIKGLLTHVDFHEVRLDQTIHASVAVHLVGESPGVKQGGVLQQVMREVNIEALPTAIPEHIEVSIDTLEVGGAVRLEDVPPIEGVTFLDDPHETVLASCTIPRGITELEEAEAEEAEAEEGEEGAEAAEGAAEGSAASREAEAESGSGD